ncbi:MAG: bifunctional phosphopantothenoylcysteine decarboxylase/phosphopantothenate--cysteine ligase CoaBC [Brevinematia bacterium]
MRIVIGVTSSVSIYKVLNVIRGLIKRGNEVKVVMSHNATKLISPLLFQTISQNKVYVDNFNNDDPLIHITLAKWGDVFVVVPATANIIGKIANGIADDLVSTIALAFPYSKKRMIVPAMNKEMWINPINQKNITKLKEYNWDIVEPEEGLFASPLEGKGKGRLPNEKTIVYSILRKNNGILKDKKVIVTAGATKEYIDNVRFISNDSSGLMGLSLALVSYLEGADVCLIYGEMKYTPPKFIKSIKVVSTHDMLEQVEKEFINSDILLMPAAVSDFKPSKKFSGKLSKDQLLEIKLEKTPDILKEISKKKKRHQIVIGFALTSNKAEEYAIAKMREKKLDFVVANQLELKDGKITFNPMGSRTNKVTIFSKDGSRVEFEGSKLKVARSIIEYISKNIETQSS